MTILRKGQHQATTLDCSYPAPFHEGVGPLLGLPLSDLGGLSQFGAHMDTLPPGSLSSQRHWHEQEDEFIYILSGTATLVDDDGEHGLEPGDAAAFPAGEANGHHLRNDGDGPCSYLIFGTRLPDEVAHYPDIDMKLLRRDGKGRFTSRDGIPYPRRQP